MFVGRSEDKVTYSNGLSFFSKSRPDKFALIKVSFSLGKVEYVHKPAIIDTTTETMSVLCSLLEVMAVANPRRDRTTKPIPISKYEKNVSFKYESECVCYVR